jgi:L-aminopeptidase/D-esterase-like protein
LACHYDRRTTVTPGNSIHRYAAVQTGNQGILYGSQADSAGSIPVTRSTFSQLDGSINRNFVDSCGLLETSAGSVNAVSLADSVAFVHELSAAKREADTFADDDRAPWTVLAKERPFPGRRR